MRNDGCTPRNRPTREENELYEDELELKRSVSMIRGGGDKDRGISNSGEKEGEEQAFTVLDW